MQGQTPDKQTLEREAATALGRIKTASDLDARIGVLKAREEIATNNLAAFIVAVPEGYDDEDRAVFTKEVNQAIEKALEGAKSQVDYDRMWNRS